MPSRRGTRARLREVRFQQPHHRRGQTEARIAIFKNASLGARLVAWNVLTHNLWLLSGLPKRELRALRKAS